MIECDVSELIKAINQLKVEKPNQRKMTKELLKVICDIIENNRKITRQKKIDTILFNR